MEPFSKMLSLPWMSSGSRFETGKQIVVVRVDHIPHATLSPHIDPFAKQPLLMHTGQRLPCIFGLGFNGDPAPERSFEFPAIRLIPNLKIDSLAGVAGEIDADILPFAAADRFVE